MTMTDDEIHKQLNDESFVEIFKAIISLTEQVNRLDQHVVSIGMRLDLLEADDAKKRKYS